MRCVFRPQLIKTFRGIVSKLTWPISWSITVWNAVPVSYVIATASIEHLFISKCVQHWHGLFNPGNFNDGVSFVTQCPIVPGHTYRYNFEVPNQVWVMVHPPVSLLITRVDRRERSGITHTCRRNTVMAYEAP